MTLFMVMASCIRKAYSGGCKESARRRFSSEAGLQAQADPILGIVCAGQV